MKLILFSKLNAKAKDRARRDYKTGWCETHPEDSRKPFGDLFSDDEVSADGDARFTAAGKYIKSV